MAGILIVYIRVLISWKITCVIFNLGGTKASVAFFDAFDVELGTLLPANRAFVHVEKAGTHVSNLDWRRSNVWSTSEDQIRSVSQSVKKTGRFVRRFFLDAASPNCILRGIAEPRAPSFFDTLVEDNLRARYVQNIRSMEYSARVEELAGFYRDQRWKHMHDVLRGQGITFEELGRRGGKAGGKAGRKANIEAIVAILEAEGFTRIEALRVIGLRLRGGALASLEAQGFTGEDGTRSASTELGRRGGDAFSEIYRTSGDCSYPGCTYAVYSGEFCGKHHPKKPEKSDKCRVCKRVFGAKEQIRGGVCMPCYKKPEAKAAREKATAEKKAVRGICSTPGCNGWKHKGRDKCVACLDFLVPVLKLAFVRSMPALSAGSNRDWPPKKPRGESKTHTKTGICPY